MATITLDVENMATITLDVEKMMKNKKGSFADGYKFGSSSSSSGGMLGSLLLDSVLMNKKKKKAAYYKASDDEDSDDDDDDEEQQYYQKQRPAADIRFSVCPHIAVAILEDQFGLSSLRSKEEGEKMKKPLLKNNTSSSSSSSSSGDGGRSERVSIKKDEEAMTVKMEMPGLGKENVKVRVVNNTLLIETFDDEDENENGMKKKNNWGMYLPDDEYKCEEMKAVMKNGVLTVVVPKKKDEERKDVMVFQVQD